MSFVVRQGGTSYPVIVAPGASAGLAARLAAEHAGRRAVVISDDTVAAALPSPLPEAPWLRFPAGETHKSRASWSALTDELLARRCDRHTLIVAFGGGVTTDLAGFVAATFLRGVPWIAVPTTTLAMLDASVGGKTGVDTPAGKNLVGAFHPPAAVVIDPDLLRTLPERAFREGLAEAVKHAAILDAEHGAWLHAHAAAILARDPATLTTLVEHNVRLKAGVVEEDEREGGRRAILNAGHTVAHGLERLSDYALPHGEAVALGLLIETRVAERMGRCVAGTADRLATILDALGLPVVLPPGVGADALIDAMRGDKKNRDGAIRAALLSTFGDVCHSDDDWTLPLDLPALRELL